jgi:predicted transcriptional regulator
VPRKIAAVLHAMTTTTIRLPEALKTRIDKLAASAGKSPHAFMVDTLAESTEMAERQQAFEAEAERRWSKYQRTGEYISHEDMKAYVRALARGEKPARPKVRKHETQPRAAKRA